MISLPDNNKCRVAVIGLGYVGLPLAIQISGSKSSYLDHSILDRKVIGFDISLNRLEELRAGFDRTKESSKKP